MISYFLLVYDAETDEDEAKTEEKPFELLNFFHGKHFYVFGDDYDDKTLHDIRRVIYAYDGILEKQMASNVKYIITNRMWNQDFEKVYIRFLKSRKYNRISFLYRKTQISSF
jgi:hypothetical protein